MTVIYIIDIAIKVLKIYFPYFHIAKMHQNMKKLSKNLKSLFFSSNQDVEQQEIREKMMEMAKKAEEVRDRNEPVTFKCAKAVMGLSVLLLPLSLLLFLFITFWSIQPEEFV